MIASSIYLSGSTIEAVNPVAAIAEPDWRSLAMTKLQRSGLTVVNPLQLTWSAGELDEGGERQVRRALELIDESDAILANLLRPSYGTAMEIFYAHRRGKVVTVVGQTPFSPWVLSHSQARFQDINHALDYLIDEPPQFDLISWALRYEGVLAERYEQLPPAGEPDYQFLGGDLPVLVLAPHATAFFREGEFQNAESFSGAATALLHRQARCHALMSYYCCVADPLTYLETPMVRALADIVKAGQVGLVMIVLGSQRHESSGLQVEALASDQVLGDELASRLRLRLSALEPITSDRSERAPEPLLRFIAYELGVPVLALRMHKRYRMPRLQPEPFGQIVALVKEFIEETGLEFLRSAS
jgi:hypothetical protein